MRSPNSFAPDPYLFIATGINSSDLGTFDVGRNSQMGNSEVPFTAAEESILVRLAQLRNRYKLNVNFTAAALATILFLLAASSGVASANGAPEDHFCAIIDWAKPGQPAELILKQYPSYTSSCEVVWEAQEASRGADDDPRKTSLIDHYSRIVLNWNIFDAKSVPITEEVLQNSITFRSAPEAVVFVNDRRVRARYPSGFLFFSYNDRGEMVVVVAFPDRQSGNWRSRVATPDDSELEWLDPNLFPPASEEDAELRESEMSLFGGS